MKIIDAHMHLGEDLIFNTDDSEGDLLAAMNAHGLDAQIVQPGIMARDQRAAHKRIHDFARTNPGRVYGLACFSPYMEEETYHEAACWAVRELGFKGLKVHPYAFCMAPSHPAAEKIYRTALELEIPVMIHTGNGVPNALPSLCIPVARKYPGLTIVMAHAGGGTFGAEALITAQECPNIYLETSWTTVHDLKKMVGVLGAERVMFGSDLLANIPVELAKYGSLGLKDAQLEWCLGRTAAKAFRLS